MPFFRRRRNNGARKAPAAITRKPRKGSHKHPDRGLKLSRAMSALVVKENNKYKETKSGSVNFPMAPIIPRIGGILAVDSGAAAVPASIWRLCPGIKQGDSESERIGLTLQPVSLRVHGFITFPVDAANTGADAVNSALMNIRFYILSSKKVKNYTSLGAIGGDPANPTFSGFQNMSNRLLQLNGQVGQYSGKLEEDQLWSTNHKEVTVHKMRNYQIKRLNCFANTSGYQRPVKIPFSFNVPVPRQLLYNTDIKATPQQYAPMLVVGNCYENNAAPSGALAVYPQIIVTSTLKFKDA